MSGPFLTPASRPTTSPGSTRRHSRDHHASSGKVAMGTAYDEPLIYSLPTDMRGFNETQFMSSSDVRRILSGRAHEKHKEKIAQMKYDHKHGKPLTLAVVTGGLLEKVTDDDVTLVTQSWEYLVKLSHVEGPRLITAFLRGQPYFYPGMLVKSRDHSEDSGHVTGVECRRHMSRVGRRLVDDVMTLLHNIQNEEVLLELLEGHFRSLREMGHEAHSVREHRRTFVSHLKETLCSKWSPALEAAWTKVIDALLQLWEHFLRDGSLYRGPPSLIHWDMQ